VLNEAEITRILVKALTALDEQDWDTIKEVFTREATMDLSAPMGHMHGRDAILELYKNSGTNYGTGRALAEQHQDFDSQR
jgi:hypothetical protein